MQNGTLRSRWLMVMILFLFLLFSQLLGFFVEQITLLVSEFSSITERWFNFIYPTDLIFMMLFLPLGGVLFDRNLRKPLLSLSSFLWGISGWLMGIAPTFATFNVSRAVFGLSRVSYSGIYAMAGDYFQPVNRGKILSLLLLAHPLSIVLGTLFEDVIVLELFWREFLILMGAIAFLITILIHIKLIEPKRGASEPALSDISLNGTYQINRDSAKLLITNPSLVLIYFLIFFGTIPAVALLEGLVIYLKDVHNLLKPEIYSTILPGMLGVVLGYPAGGIIGDALFKRKKSGRLFLCLLGFLVALISVIFALRTRNVSGNLFLSLILMTGFFIGIPLPNLFASIMDVTLPELRASAMAIVLFLQTFGFVFVPRILAFGMSFFSIVKTILIISIVPWIICLFLMLGMFIHIKKDIEALRSHMAFRGLMETRPTRLEG